MGDALFLLLILILGLLLCSFLGGNYGKESFTSTTTNNDYGFDRFRLRATDGTVTYSAQTFTAGTAPVAGYESTNYARIVSSGQTNTTTAAAMLRQTIEDVRVFAGQTLTISFWAQAGTGTPFINAYVTQSFGSGGSTAVSTNTTKQTITTSWARYSFTIPVPSIAGKTIGAGSNLLISIACSAGTSFLSDYFVQNNTFDIWGVQVEAGSVATPFQTATGTVQGELSACQRYFQILGNLFGYAQSATSIQGSIASMPMRTTPTAALTTGTPTGESPINVTAVTGASSTTAGSGDLNQYGSQFIRVTGFTGLVANTFSYVTGGQITLSAEL